MLNIIKMDFYKMIKSKSFYAILIALISMMLVLAVFMRVSLNRDYEVGKESSFGFISDVSDKPTNAPDITEKEYYLIQDSIVDDLNISSIINATYKSPVMIILLTAFVALFVGSELESGYIKNIAPLHNSRLSLLVSKNIMAALFIVVQAFVLFISSLLVLLIVKGNFESFNIKTLLSNVSLHMLLMLAFSSLLLFTTYLFKNKTVTVAIGIILAFNVIGMALNTIDGMFNIMDIGLSKLTIVGNSVIEEFSKFDYPRILIVFIVYFLIYNLLTLIHVRKMEIK